MSNLEPEQTAKSTQLGGGHANTWARHSTSGKRREWMQKRVGRNGKGMTRPKNHGRGMGR
eukprot:1155815-Pelagomonas_calceolata.AAC.2